jgi:hypothetical protein
MPAIDPDSLEQPLQEHSPYRVPMEPAREPRPRSSDDGDPAMVFAAVILLLASLVRLVPPFAGQEDFGVEPTLALGATIGCGWLTLREALFRLRALRAERGAGAMVRSRTID